MLEIDFNFYDHNFCESTIYSTGQHPEYLNSFSSLFITFIGFLGLFKPHTYLTLSMTSACLVINGVFSFMYHYYNTIGWGLLDRMSMIILAINSTYLFINNILNVYPKYKNWYHLSVASYYSLLFTIAGLHHEQLFNSMFGLFLLSLIYFMNQLTILFYIPDEIKKLGWRGVKLIICSGLFWIGTEHLCTKFFFVKYLFGHVWWHVLVSLGGYYVSLIPKYLHMKKYINKNAMSIVIYYDYFNLPYLEYHYIL